MKCQDFRADFLAGELTEDHFSHLTTCASCRSEQDSLSSITEQLDDREMWAEPSEGLGEGIVASIGDQATPAEGRSRRGWLPAAAVAAVVAAGAVVAAVLVAGGGNPDWEVAFQGTELAAGAEGTISGWNTDSGTRVTIDADRLAPSPDGFVYELWFSADDVHVSAGTFVAADNVDLWVGVSRAEFRRVWVTLEPVDDDPAPSRRVIFDDRG